jgi:hypothetical protein
MDRIASLLRNSRCFSILAAAFFVTLLALQPGFAEQNGALLPDTTAAAVEAGVSPAAAATSIRPFSKVAVGVTFGLMGPGIEVATPISRRTNLRVDGSFFSYNVSSFTADNANYSGNLKLRDIRTSYDFFPFHGSFRLSAGVELYNQVNINANANVAADNNLTLNSVDYYSNPANPLQANASLVYGNKVAPTFSFGWGNAIPRSKRHWAFPIEIGAAYTGTPKFGLNVQGTGCLEVTCETPGAVPVSPQTDPTFQSNLNAQIAKVKNDLNPAKFYPIINAGLTYKF